METLDAIKDFFATRMSFVLHPVQRQAIEESCPIITVIEKSPEQFRELLDLGAEEPMTLHGVPCRTTFHASPSEIIVEVDGKEVARIIGLEVPGGF